MATKRKRARGWEFVVRRRNVLPRPVYLTFDTEEEGDRYCARLEGLLDRGIIPEEIAERTARGVKPLSTIADAIYLYLTHHAVPHSETRVLEVIAERDGAIDLGDVDNTWSTKWVASMKRTRKLAPGTIRHNVGALARCFDWFVRERPTALPVNPLRSLPRGYSKYSVTDTRVSGIERLDDSRDRRLSPAEEAKIRTILAGEMPAGRQRPLDLVHRDALVCFFDLALETAMRMREMYTLEVAQIDFAKRTIFLDETKNGAKRQVPMTSVCVGVLESYLGERAKKKARPARSRVVSEFLFPWFDGEFTESNLRRLTSLLSRQFARIFDAAGCEDLRFHDLRHEATSRFYERTTLRDREIAAITGHKDPRMLARYSNLRGSDLAKSLW